MRLLMIYKACMPVYMNSGKIVADGWTGGRGIKGSTRGPRGPKKKRTPKKHVMSKKEHILS